MKITYHIGPSKNRYCKIVQKRGETIYNIDGILKRGRFDQADRLNLYLQIIGMNYRIPHTHLIFLVQELAYNPSKRTIEEDLDYFEKVGNLDSEKFGDSSNSTRRWSLHRPMFDYEIQTKKEAKAILQNLERYVSKIEKNYDRFSEARRDWAMTNLLRVLHSYQSIIGVINLDVRIRKEKQTFDSLVKRSYNIFKNDNRDFVDGRPMLRRLLHLKSSNAVMEMEEFCNEIDGKKKLRPPVPFI